jgi:hypothetical protein
MAMKYVESGEHIAGLPLTYAIAPHPVLDPAEAKLAAIRESVAIAFRELSGQPQNSVSLTALRAKMAGLRAELLEVDRLIASLPAAWMHKYREEQARLLREGRRLVGEEISSLDAALRSCALPEKAAEKTGTRSVVRRIWEDAFESRIGVPGASLNLKKLGSILKEWWRSRNRARQRSAFPD